MTSSNHSGISKNLSDYARRLIDIVAATGGLLILSPVFIGSSIAVHKSSPGPIIFQQIRLGRFGEPFALLKFRSMSVNDDRKSIQVTASKDPRITHVGSFLRKWKIDELPQLINVLRGQMSLVGPRPEVARYAEHWTDRQRQVILSVRPGITDPVTISLRNEEAILATQADPEQYYRNVLLPIKAESYVEYVQNRTLIGDFKIIFKTIEAVIKG